MTNYEILKKDDMLAAMEERLHKNCCWCVNYERCGEPDSKPSQEKCKAMWRIFFKGADTPKKLADRMSRAHDCDECPVLGICGETMCGCVTNIIAWLRNENVLYSMAIDAVKQREWLTEDAKEILEEVLTQLPSAQPEIIRCKDCRYYQDNNDGYPHINCKWDANETPDADDFCSGAERRTDG